MGRTEGAMTITFVSNYHNHHQIPFCDELIKVWGVDFKFIATEKVPAERIELGYFSDFSMLDYYLEIGTNISFHEAEKIVFNSDVVIIGSAPDEYIWRRLKENKLTFRYNERLFKQGFIRHPGDVLRGIADFNRYIFKPFYVLCASSFTSLDLKKIGFFKKNFKWGYFPKAIEYSYESLMSNKSNEILNLLWVGRLIDWKHPDDFIKICTRLRNEGFRFHADMIGNGPMKTELINLIHENELEDCVDLIGSMSPNEVRNHMESSNIFLFTSDRQEGWGAVLNEALNSGCAVVANKAAGSTDFLIRNGENGFAYKNGSIEEAYNYTKQLMESADLRKQFYKKAYSTIVETWNATVAAERFYKVCFQLLDRKPVTSFFDGPMSKC